MNPIENSIDGAEINLNFFENIEGCNNMNAFEDINNNILYNMNIEILQENHPSLKLKVEKLILINIVVRLYDLIQKNLEKDKQLYIYLIKEKYFL